MNGRKRTAAPNARSITQALGGTWYTSYGAAACPVCQPECRKGQNALTLTDSQDGLLLAHCKRSGCSFKDISLALGLKPGRFDRPDIAIIAQRDKQRRAQAEKKARQAYRIWLESEPIQNTIAESYLQGRGITCPLSPTLRFHPEAWHGPTAQFLPAMVALIEGVEDFSIHRTYLLPDGSGKAKVSPNKAMLGSVAGGAVQLSNEGSTLVVAEGIETALALLCGLLKKPATVWAALSAGNLANLKLPDAPGRLTIAADGDHAGHKAAHALAHRAHALDWTVSLLPAPEGQDWNDVLTSAVI